MNKVDQSKLAGSVAEKIPYEFNKEFLVKPLPVEKVKKEFTIPVSTGKHEDKNGIEANDFNEVKTEIKEVDSDFMKGIVLKVPYEYKRQLSDSKYHPIDIKQGDTLIFKRSNRYFDLVKDTMIVAVYDIIAVEYTGGDRQNVQTDSKEA